MNKQWKKAAIWAAVTGIFLVAILAFVFVPFDPAAAALDDQLEEVGTSAGLPTTSLPIMIARIIRVFLGVLGIIFLVLVIYAGYLYLTAHGEDEPIKKAKKILRNAIIGLFIILSSFAITTFILNALLSAAGLGGGVSTSAVNYSEPLSGSLGAGIIDSHYPARNALDVPRNTKIMVTFKEPIDIYSLTSNYDAAVAADPTAKVFSLNNDNVLIYKTDGLTEELKESDIALTGSQVNVSTEDQKTFIFDPVEYLGSENNDTNYTVFLGPGILKLNDDGTTDKAFTGTEDEGYKWTFEVSTEIDLTPPTVVSVIPVSGSVEARNVVIQITFSEAMDASVIDKNILVLSGDDLATVNGAATISNQYRTVEFMPDDPCGVDPCGSTIYCLPGSESIQVEAHAAGVDSTQPPQATIGADSLPTGLADASGNALDGDGDWGTATGEAGDSYIWGFTTTAEVNDIVPFIISTFPSLESNGNFDVDDNVKISFNMPMRSTTLNTSNIRLESDYDSTKPSDVYQNPWFSVEDTVVVDELSSYSKVEISHATLWESVTNDDESVTNYFYYPVIKSEVESAYQICMFPSHGPDAASIPLGDTSCSSSSSYCCQGVASSVPCATKTSTKILGK